MRNVFDVAIVGGGASGLMCAVELTKSTARSIPKVIILERNDRVGKKILATGNGQGNLTNVKISETDYHGEEKFVSSFKKECEKINIRNYLYYLGIPLSEGENGKMYPISKQASSVLDILRAILKENGVIEKTAFYVTDVSENGGIFTVKSDKGEEIFTKNVVLAFGGSAGKQFGTDGSSYVLSQKFGHVLTKLSPSLVQIKTEKNKIRGLKGLKEKAKITLVKNGKKIKTETGDLLFTDYGISGNAAFYLSAYLSGGDNEYIIVEFLPEYSEKETEKIIADKMAALPFMPKEEVLSGIINKRTGRAIFNTAKNDSPESLAKALKNFTLKVEGTLGFDYAQVTKGGIKTEDIDEKTNESKLKRGLFIIGEALDIDGDCGGYNLTYAFVSGILAAREIKRRDI